MMPLNSCCFFCTFNPLLLQLSLGWSASVLGRQTSENSKLCSLSRSLCTSCSHQSSTETSPLVACQSLNFLQDCMHLFQHHHLLYPYLSDLLHLYSPSRSLHSSADTRLLKIPLYKCKMEGDHVFSYFGPSVWNLLSLHTGNVTTINTFKSALKT